MKMNKKNQSGFTLVEILIASALGAVLFVAFFQVVFTIKQNIKLQSSYDSIQENGRFAAFFLRRVVHNAGFNACDPQQKFHIEKMSSNKVGEWPIKPIMDSDVLVAGQCQLVDGKEEFIKTAYYIANTSHAYPALFAKRWNKPRQEIIAHVANMTINYHASASGVEFDLQLTNNKQNLEKDWPIYASLQNKT